MKIPIADLMDACRPAPCVEAAEDAAMAERIIKNVNEKRITRRGRLSVSLLIAALAVLLTVGTVAAVVYSQMRVRNLSGETVETHYLMANGLVGSTEWPDASMGFSFIIEGEYKEVYIRPGWLPWEESEHTLAEREAEGFGRIVRSSSEYQDGRYEIAVYWGEQLRDTTLFMQGDARIVKEDEWNGFRRTEAVADPGVGLKDEHYLLLFSEKDNYLICICGTPDIETLEKIAGELEIRVTDTPVVPADPAQTVPPENVLMETDGGALRDDRELAEASLSFSFTVPESCPKVFFKPGWLPEGDDPGTQWLDYYTPNKMAGYRYVIRMYWGDSLLNRVFYWNVNDGSSEVVKDETWNGLRRIEIAVTERDDPYAPEIHHVLLYCEAEGWLVHIDGTSDPDTLGRIADGLQFRVTETEADVNWSKEPEYYSVAAYSGHLTGEIGKPLEYEPDVTYTFKGVERPSREAAFKPGWLPAEPNEEDYNDYGYATGICFREEDDPENPLYYVALHQDGYWDSGEIVVVLDSYEGTTAVFKETSYNGMRAVVFVAKDRYDPQSLEVYEHEVSTGEMDREQFHLPDLYSIFLYDDETDCLISISGTADLQTLERIAENLEITTLKR